MNNEFNLARAIASEPIETISGTPVEFVAYRPNVKSSKHLIVQIGDDICTYHANGKYYVNERNNASGIKRPYDLHMKPKLKQIDWAKLPVDTLLTISLCTGRDHRYFSSFSNGKVHFFLYGATSKTADSNLDVLTVKSSNVKITPDQPWTVWLGCECPIPDGLEFEYIANNEIGYIITCKENARGLSWTHQTIYAYRLTGKVLNGWKL